MDVALIDVTQDGGGKVSLGAHALYPIASLGRMRITQLTFWEWERMRITQT